MFGMVVSNEHLTNSFIMRTCILFMIIYICIMANVLFIAFANWLYKGLDNRINSFLGLIFIFSPIICALISFIGICCQIFSNEKFEIRRLTYVYYILIFLGSCVQSCTVIFYAGTTKSDDTAYEGLLKRPFC